MLKLLYLELCIHVHTLLRVLLTQFEDVKEPEDELISRKRRISVVSSVNAQRRKLDIENDSTVLNVTKSKTVNDDIQLVKKKKVVELPQELLDNVEKLKMGNLMKSFGRGSAEDFAKHCVAVMNANSQLAQNVFDLTVEQADTSIWHELRIGRITASRLHEATRCTMSRGSFVDKVMGKRSGWSFAMMRGTVLEEFVFQEVKKEFPELQRSGLVMNQNVHPFFAASPDGLHKDFVLEIKCPNTPNTFQQYIDVDKLSKKYFAQIQLQMFVTEKTKALLAVASLDFEKTRNITKVWIPFDNEYMEMMLQEAMEFYDKAIFPALKRQFLR